MFTLFHHPFCPHSRFIRLAIAEHGLDLRLVEERARVVVGADGRNSELARTVVAEQYHDKPLVRWTAFGLASAVSVARITAQKHSPSDVFVGGLIGYLIGRHVARRGEASYGHASFTFTPVVDVQTRSFGVAGSFSF